MKYWHINFEDSDYWIEVDKQGVALRQIVDNHTEIVQLSCFEDCLAEGYFEPNDMDGSVKEISKAIFEEQWNSETHKYQNKWIEHKSKYSVGAKIEGKILYFYPHGCIVEIGDALGVCMIVGEESSINDIFTGVVKGYDDSNMWIIISQIENKF